MSRGTRDLTAVEVDRLNTKARAAWKGRGRGRAAHPDADVEQPARDEPVAAEEVPRLDPPLRLRVDHYRHRLVDVDAPSIKAALDQCVREGLCRDDTTEEITEVVHRQHRIPKAEAERTTLTFEELTD